MTIKFFASTDGGSFGNKPGLRREMWHGPSGGAKEEC